MILVTGGTGLIGAHLLFYLLEKGETVRAVYRAEKNKEITREIFSFYENGNNLVDKIEWVHGDILDVVFLNEAMKNIKHVYHCAAAVSYDKRDEEMIMKTNIEGTANMVNTAITAGIEKFCHVSSIASFGRAERKDLVTEETPWDNNINPSNYSTSKYHAELEVWRGVQEGLETVIVNPAVVLGSGNWKKGSSSLINRVWNGLPYYTTGINGYVDVQDVVNCMISLMNSPVKNERFLLVSENLSYQKVLNKIAEGLKKKKPSIRVNRYLATIARYQEAIRCFLSGKPPLITRETVNVALDKQLYSNNKITETLNFDFKPVSKTIRRITADYLKSST